MRRFNLVKTRPIDVPAFLSLSRPTRWVPRRKAALVLAVRSGLITLSGACDRYMLTVDEFTDWEVSFDEEGLAGLQLKSRIRQPGKSYPRGRRPTKRVASRV
jgi:hypothetical protein